jgi:FkbM family methyltransferase
MKKIIKKIINNMGWEIHRFNSKTTADGLIASAIKHFQIDLVLDIGANEGQYAKKLIAHGYKGAICSFEPLTAAYNILIETARSYRRWAVYPRCALGGMRGVMEINVSGNSVSSSILPMMGAHLNSAPNSAYYSKELTDVIALDEIYNEVTKGFNATLLKIDTQGYEWEVLNGSRHILDKVRGIQIELSLIELYKGQRLMEEIKIRLEELGFILWGIYPAFNDLNNGRVLQLDGLFFRE